MAKTDNDRKRDLECLRLATELIQLSRETVNLKLSAHCIRMAGYWTNQVDESLRDGIASRTAQDEHYD